MRKFFYRVFQAGMYVSAFLLPWRQPKLIKGHDAMGELAQTIVSLKLNKVLIVTDKGLMQLGLLESLFLALKNKNIEYVVYDEVVPNPTISNIEEGFGVYVDNACMGIIAFGGGSPMDCAKVIGARVARPNKPVPKMKGLLKVLKPLPPFFAIPTTSGTGSETTLAAVITDEKTQHKYAINDLVLIPDYAVLDPNLTLKLPAHITAATGMDALCHAVEAYVGRANTQQTKKAAMDAICLIEQSLYTAYEEGENLQARQNMQQASYLAGVAFTRAYVGAVHAMAHTLGGYYHIAHGLANAVIMPYVFKAYGEAAHKKLAELADLIEICKPQDNYEVKANKFISWIEEMNKKMGIPDHFSEILDKDIDTLASFAVEEANPLYPLPKILMKEEYASLFKQLQKGHHYN